MTPEEKQDILERLDELERQESQASSWSIAETLKCREVGTTVAYAILTVLNEVGPLKLLVGEDPAEETEPESER